MNKYPQTTTVIEDHTENVGKAKYNTTLAQKRPDNVRDLFCLSTVFGILI